MSNLSEFERGALWALDLLKKQVHAQTDDYRRVSYDCDVDLSGLINGTRNVLLGMLGRYESAFVSNVKEAQRDKSDEATKAV